MLVTVKGFGSIWERRFGQDDTGARRFGQAAFYNTTGVVVNGTVRYRWRVGGKIRFNGAGGFTPLAPRHALDHVFECDEPETTSAGWTQILLKRKLHRPARPDFYLFAVTTESTGRLSIPSESWKADSVQVVALSEQGERQEGMLLMPAYSWIHSELGTFFVEPSQGRLWSAELRLARVD